MTAEPLPHFTFEEYLRLEQLGEGRHEWVAGQVHLMSGGSDRHTVTAQALFTRLSAASRARGCRIFHADRSLKTADASYYPDVFVVCGPRADRLFETDAELVIEVLSPSTETIDRREKASAYAGLPGLGVYVLADPETSRLHVGTREPDGTWSWVHHPPKGVVGLLDVDIDLADLWAEVDELAPL